MAGGHYGPDAQLLSLFEGVIIINRQMFSSRDGILDSALVVSVLRAAPSVDACGPMFALVSHVRKLPKLRGERFPSGNGRAHTTSSASQITCKTNVMFFLSLSSHFPVVLVQEL